MKEGDFVHYIPISGFGKPENGRIKTIGEEYAFVVYSCNGWDRYEDYTGQRTAMANLKPGWSDRYGNSIDTPKIEP